MHAATQETGLTSLAQNKKTHGPMKKTFFVRYSTLILVVVCFFTPFVLRGARDALRNMKNDVKDWLPSRFKETADIEWFWRHFAGERFIIATWEGCTGDATDEAFHLFKRKLSPAIPPSKQGMKFPAPPAKDVGSTWLDRPYEFFGDRLGLYAIANEHLNWGGLQEKWLRGAEDRWYYITPNGDLFAFMGGDGPMPALGREIAQLLGMYKLQGKQLATFGPVDGPWFYKNPSRLNAQLFRSVVTGPDVLAALTKESESGVQMMTEKMAMEKLKGALFGPDEKQTAMIITMTEAGRANFHRVLGRGVLGKERGELYRIAEDCGISADDLRLGGPPVDNVSIDEEGTITLVRLVSLCVLLGLTLSYLSFRSWLATITLFLTGGIGAVLGLAVVGWSGTTADAVMMSMPALVYVLGISGAVHLINYYREAVEEHGVAGAPERALGHAWKPAILCNITTAIGLLSLYSAEVVPIQKFGIFAAAGVLCSTVLLFTYVPAVLQTWPLNLPKTQKREDGAESWLDAFLADYWGRFGGWIIRHYVFVGTSCLLLISVIGYGVTRINTSVNLLELYDGNAKIVKDYAWIESHLGKLIPMEVVVKFSPDSLRKSTAELGNPAASVEDQRAAFTTIDRLEAVAKVESYIARYLGDGKGGAGVVGQSMSAVTFAPKLPSASDFSARAAFDVRLSREREELLKSDFFKVDQDDGSELWRLSLRVAAFKGIDLGDFVKELREVVEPVMAAYNLRHNVLHGIIEQQSQQQVEGDGGPSAIRVGFVMPDALVKSAFPKAPPKKRASQKAKEAIEAPVVEEEIVANEPFVRIDIDRDMIFARTLADSLRTARVGIQVIPESKFQADQLAGLDRVLLLGSLSPATFAAVRAHSADAVDGKAYLAESIASSDNSNDHTVSRAKHRTTTAVYTGVVPIVYKAQRTLLTSLIDSTTWSFLTITPLMMLVARSIPAGAVAMLPNALPVLVIFGAMGWMGIRVDIGSMMTASIALGVAVDDTIHYLTWFREELQRTGDRKLAILGAYRRCATPTFQAATISGLGLSIFAFSTFTPTQRFGYLMLAILFAGVVAELVFFPALLASPLGLAFKVTRKPGEPPVGASSGGDDSGDPGSGDSDSGDRDSGSPATVRIDAAREASKRIALF